MSDLVIPARSAPATALDPRRWWTLAVLCMSLLIIVVDNTIVNVALPTLVRELGTSVSELQWVVDAYTLVFAGLLLLAGTLGDKFGRRRSLLAGLAVFGAASAAAAFANGVTELVTARAVMGGAAAFIMPATLSILTNVFTDATERAAAIGMWAGVAGVGVALGPVLGGFLLDHFWWGSVFIVNVPIVVIALVAVRAIVPESRSRDHARLDWLGGLLSIVGLVSLVWAIIEAPTHGWTAPETIVGAVVAVVSITAFVTWERRVPDPMLDVRFFRNARFSAASATIMLMFFALFGFIFLSTQFLQFVLGYSPFSAGLRTLPFAGAMILAAPSSSKVVEVLGTKRTVVVGMLTFATGLIVASTSTVASGYPRLGIAMLLMGAGLGLAAPPATESIMGSLPPDRAGVGSAMNDTTREVGGALGVAIIGSLMSSIYASQVADHLPRNVAPNVAREAEDSIGAALGVSSTMGRAGVGIADAAREAFVHAMSRASLITAVVSIAGAVVAWRFLPARAVDHADATDPVKGDRGIDRSPLASVGVERA